MLLSGSVVLLLLTVQPLFGPVAGGEVAGADEQLPRRTNCLLMSTARSGMRRITGASNLTALKFT